MTFSKTPYVPSFLRAAVSGTRPITMTFSEVSDTNILSTSSFAYDATNTGLKSTQQLNVDWSKFEKHTFFSSAEANVNMAFEQIINGFPFDGTRSEVEKFLESLTGFEKWVFDNFPRYHGALHFSGSWIEVKDHAGALYPDISKNKSGESVLNPKDGASLSIEMQLYLPTITNGNTIVCQKLSGSNYGFSLQLSASTSTGSCQAQFTYVSGAHHLSTTATLTKGQYNHVCVVLNREEGTPFASFYNNEELVDTSRGKYNFGELPIDSTTFYIGSGSTVQQSTSFVPTTTLSGSIDELRVFHAVRTLEQQKLYAQKSIYAGNGLKLYYRFNEPSPLLGLTASDSVNSIVLDSSGNALHALVSNFTGSLREGFSDHSENPMVYERSGSYPVLFPAHEDVVALNAELLNSASLYDAANPNLITRLIPEHYLLEGANFDGFENVEGTTIEPYSGEGIPGQGVMGNQQLMLSFLYIWAKFFDEMKLYIDAFSNMRFVDYESYDTIPDNFLTMLVKQYGFHLPPLFNKSTIDQYINGENIGSDISSENHPLKYVQQQLMRRVLINMPDVIRSKGTQHSIKAFLRAIGIDPENSVRIREYGGPTEKQLSFSRETKRETNYMLQFSTSSLVVSPFLTASRREVGYPLPRGTFVKSAQFPPHGVSNNLSDGLFTSGSWTVEGILKYPPSIARSLTSTTQSLMRMCVTGSSTQARPGLVFNLVAVSASVPKVVLYGRPNGDVDAPVLRVELPFSGSATPFDGDHWNFSFGRHRHDEIESRVSSSYYVRFAKADGGQVVEYAATGSFFDSYYPAASGDSQIVRNTLWNVSGSFLSIGANQSIASGSGVMFLNDTATAPSEARAVSFDGWVSNVRFWTMSMSESVFREHTRNFKSTGVTDPLENWNFTVSPSGSWGKLRLDSISKQSERNASSAGRLTFWDFSKNTMHLTGTGFPASTEVLKGETFEYSYLSPYYDDAATDEKIRIRGFQDANIIKETPWANVAPVYEVPKSEQPSDDVRFAVEFSLVDALNRDIVNIFATFDALDNAIGDPSLVYSPDYPDLDRLRDIYFQRISARLNFKQFFEFFKWFDTTIGTFIEQLIPRKAKFRGTNFLIESHMLERHKLEYFSQEIYLGDTERRIVNNLLVQLIAGNIRKY